MTKQEWVEGFGFNLQTLMREFGISQTELANEAGLSQADVSRYINGQQIPTAPTIVKLAYTLNCGVEDLIDFGETIVD